MTKSLKHRTKQRNLDENWQSHGRRWCVLLSKSFTLHTKFHAILPLVLGNFYFYHFTLGLITYVWFGSRVEGNLFVQGRVFLLYYSAWMEFKLSFFFGPSDASSFSMHNHKFGGGGFFGPLDAASFSSMCVCVCVSQCTSLQVQEDKVSNEDDRDSI